MANELVRGAAGKEGEVASVVTNLIRAFGDGLDVFKRLRERRKKRRSKKDGCAAEAAGGGEVGPLAPSGMELQLSDSLRRGPEDIARCYGDCYSRAGDRFARGDGKSFCVPSCPSCLKHIHP